MPNRQMQLIIGQLRAQAAGKMNATIAGNLYKTARPFAPLVRAAIVNIPSAGGKPYKQPPGLRLRIARCVTPFASWRGDLITIGVEMDPRKMPSGQYALPLYMQGAKPRWRHPLFGDYADWYAQQVPAHSGQGSHPYFYGVMTPLGPASRKAIERALDSVTRQISGAG